MGEIMNWATGYAITSDEIVISNEPEDTDELMNSWRDFLKEELAASE